MTQTLTPAELVAVTGKRRIAAQAGALARMVEVRKDKLCR